MQLGAGSRSLCRPIGAAPRRGPETLGRPISGPSVPLDVALHCSPRPFPALPCLALLHVHSSHSTRLSDAWSLLHLAAFLLTNRLTPQKGVLRHCLPPSLLPVRGAALRPLPQNLAGTVVAEVGNFVLLVSSYLLCLHPWPSPASHHLLLTGEGFPA